MDTFINNITIIKSAIKNLPTRKTPALYAFTRKLYQTFKRERILYKLFLRIEKRVSKTKKPDNNIIRKENSQPLLLMDMKNPKLNISKSSPIFHLL